MHQQRDKRRRVNGVKISELSGELNGAARRAGNEPCEFRGDSDIHWLNDYNSQVRMYLLDGETKHEFMWRLENVSML